MADVPGRFAGMAATLDWLAHARSLGHDREGWTPHGTPDVVVRLGRGCSHRLIHRALNGQLASTGDLSALWSVGRGYGPRVPEQPGCIQSAAYDGVRSPLDRSSVQT